MRKTLLRGGTLVSSKGVKKSDILISGGKIIAIGRHLNADAEQVDVKGKLLFPGFIDAHTHFDLEVSDTVTADRFETGTKSALEGGVTTVVDFATQNKGETLSEALNNWHMKAFANSSCDYAFHMAISDWNDEIRRELPAMFEQGVSSFKVYMTYPAMILSDREIYEILSALKPLGGIVGCHCENAGIIDGLRADACRTGALSAASHPLTRPSYTEAEAVARFLKIARAVDVPVIVVHLSTLCGLEEIRRARKDGVRAYVETCPQYLLLDSSLYTASFSEASKYVCSPPLRGADDRRALWRGLETGEINTVSTDHCSFTLEQKKAGAEDFRLIPNGMPGVGTRAPLIYTYGVRRRRISLEQMVALLSENPAKLYGMYPKKGCLKVGSDADIVVFNPRGSGIISANDSYAACGYSPFEGVRTEGRIEQVYLRGSRVFADGKVIVEHTGRYVTRKPLST